MIDIILTLLALLIVFFQLFLFYRNRKLSPPSYQIAVIGFPRTGKTSLLTVWFHQLFFKRKRRDVLVVPRGSSTIEKINGDYADLSVGKQIGPTTDQDLFAYRCDMERGKWFKQRYKIAIGDFPGEDSEKFAQEFGNKFHKTPYFKWMMDADAFIIIFDVACLLQDKEVMKKNVADFKAAIISAWQHVAEHHYEGKMNLKDKPVILVFTKSDLFAFIDEPIDEPMVVVDVVSKNVQQSGKIQQSGTDEIPEVCNKIDAVSKNVQQWGFDEIPEVCKMDNKKLENGMKLAKEQLADLIRYFELESNQFSIVFASAFGESDDSDKNERLGMKELTEKILPEESPLLSAFLKRLNQLSSKLSEFFGQHHEKHKKKGKI